MLLMRYGLTKRHSESNDESQVILFIYHRDSSAEERRWCSRFFMFRWKNDVSSWRCIVVTEAEHSDRDCENGEIV